MSGGKRMSKKAVKAEPAVDVAVGQRIRDLRRSRKLSLETIAARTDLSIGFLSQIERGLSSPSLRVLATIADVLGVGIAGLFGAKETAGDRFGCHRHPRAAARRIEPVAHRHLQAVAQPVGFGRPRSICFWSTWSPAAAPAMNCIRMTARKPVSCIEGEMKLTVDAESWTLKQGDSFRFASRRPHRFSNPSGKAKAVVLWVNCVSAAG